MARSAAAAGRPGAPPVRFGGSRVWRRNGFGGYCRKHVFD